jgi:DNA (cytosine-5)-methyltransferase 3A
MESAMIVLSLFDGISCGHVAFDRAGINIKKYYASEIDKYAIRITQNNYPLTVQLGSVLEYDVWDIEQPDIITGGFPCQPYSNAGKRKGLDDKRGGNILDAMFGIIKNYCPRDLFFENVKGLLSIDNGDTFKFILRRLNSLGYAVDWILINSALVSAQNRERVYIVCKRLDDCAHYQIQVSKNNKRNNHKSLFDDHNNIIVFDSMITQPEDKKIYLKDILQTHGEGVIKSHGIINSRSDKAMRLDSSYYKGVDNHGQRTMIITGGRITGRNPDNPTSREPGIPTVQMLEIKDDGKSNCLSTVGKDSVVVMKQLSHGNNNGFEKPCDKAPAMTTSSYEHNNLIRVGSALEITGHDYNRRVYSTESKCPTLCGEAGGDLEPKIASSEITWRKLTPLECERLQTLPDNYTLVLKNNGRPLVSNSRRYHALGNGWTVDVIAYIFSHLLKKENKR